MSELALQTGLAGLPEAPSAKIAPALAATLALDPTRLQKMTLEREILHELPGERRVERIILRERGKAVATAVAKTDLDGRNERLFRVLAPLDLPIPKLLAYLPEYRLLLMEEARGERLDHRMAAAAGAGEATSGRAGAALAIFHRHRPKGLKRITMKLLLGRLQPQPSELPGTLGGAASRLADALQRLHDPALRRLVLCHRDLHPRQIIDNGRQATIIDLDLASLGNPALDLANFDVYLRVRHPQGAASIFAAFCQGYAEAGGLPRDPRAERVYRTFTYLRLAVKTCRTAPDGWPELTARLLDNGLAELSGRDVLQEAAS